MVANTFLTSLLAAVVFSSGVYGRSVPDNLQTFYNQVKGGSCPNVVKNGMSKDGSGGGFSYCSDPGKTVMWIAGPSCLADMDVDCDGANRSGGKCANDPTGQSMTAFMDEVTNYGISDLDANIHGYVVLGTKNFDPQSVGVKSLSVVAVVCNNKMFYGVWGDTNGANSVGEASISLANACFGDGITGDNGHDGTDVLYLAFIGDEAKIGNKANWKAKSFKDFEASLASVGDKLVAKVSV